jgi:hypothetical protein
MAWDPTDTQAWKRVMEGSSSPASSARPAKKPKVAFEEAEEATRLHNAEKAHVVEAGGSGKAYYGQSLTLLLMPQP